jgi:integrase
MAQEKQVNRVQPIRDLQKIAEMKAFLKEKSAESEKLRMRNYFLFVLGINIGIRISDVITLKVHDMFGNHVTITEKKTGKYKRYLLNAKLKAEADSYINGMESENYLFSSQKGGHITRIQAYNIINSAARAVGIEDEIGTHTLRKTFGYWHYKQHKDIATLQIIFNHSSPSDTLRYIGIEQDQIDEMAEGFFL